MGTTMHAHIEVKKAEKWLHYGNPAIRRDYAVFACINGTRSDGLDLDVYRIQPVCGTREIPDDISEVTKTCLEYDSGAYKIHGTGVIGSEELKTLQKNLRTVFGPQNPNYDLEEGVFRTYINSGSIASHAGFDDVRVIFWFDN